MNEAIRFVEGMQFLSEAKTMSTEKLTYEEVCKTLKFYCGWNPKTKMGIASKISKGLPTLTNISVSVENERWVTIKFCMPNGERKTYRYPE